MVIFWGSFLLLHGPTGKGKSHRINLIIEGINYWYEKFCRDSGKNFKKLEVLYKKNNKWFDGYLDQEIIVIEEIEPSWVTISGNLLKQLCDQYPFPVEVKGASLNKIRPQFVIMTSNYNLKELCTDSKGKLIEEIYFPLKRRIKTYLVNNKEDKIIWPDPNNLLKYWSTLHIAKRII